MNRARWSAAILLALDNIWHEDVHAHLALDDVKTLTSGVTLTYRAGA